ncbi:MAG: exonuclease domain-containing protein [Steroidobacteraceae bacterium]
MARRFRGFLPIVVDVETGGFSSVTDALLEIAAVVIEIDASGLLHRGETHSYHVRPFEGANIEPAALAVNGIDPFHPLRPALPEKDALGRIFREVRDAMKRQGCKRAVLVGHNSSFDLGFLNAAVARGGIKRNPFHPFSSFDTATLAGQRSARPFSRKRRSSLASTLRRARHIPPPTMLSERRNCFATSATPWDASFRAADTRARELGWSSTKANSEPNGDLADAQADALTDEGD